MKTHAMLCALLVTTSFSTAVCGMDVKIYTETQDFDRMNPDRSFGKQVLTHMRADVKEGMGKDFQEFLDLARKALNGDWASVAGVGIHQLVDHLNGQFLNRYHITKNPVNGDFNPESFKPFLKAFREKVTLLLQGWLSQKGSSYAFNKNTGERYPIFMNTPFSQFADFFIPDIVPMKSLFISICNGSQINDYLGNKLDELAITCLLTLYKNQTGETFKEAIAPSILNMLKGGATSIHDALTTDYEDHKSSPKLAAEIEPYSPIVDYLQPRLTHLAREALHSLFLDVSQSVNELIIDQGTKAALGNPLVTNSVKGATLGLAGLSGTAGWSFGGLAGGFVGGLTGSYIGSGMGLTTGAGMGYKLANTLGGEAWGLLGAGMGGVIGAPLGFTIGSLGGATIGAWSGSVMGGSAGFVGTYTLVPRLTTHIANSLAQTTKQEMNNQLKLLVDYYTYNLLPLTKEEHVLYHLNPEPTPEERAIYHEEYEIRDQLLSQTLAGEVIKQFIDVNGIFPSLDGINEKYQSFIKYCSFSKDATVKEILEKTQLADHLSDKVKKDEKSDKIWREFILRTTGQNTLTPEDQLLKENLAKFPSFKVKQQYLEQLSLYMNSRSATDLKGFAETFHGIKESVKAEEERIKKIHQTINEAGERIAQLYQKATGSDLNPGSIKIIEQSANALWDTATSTRLDRLMEALQHQGFISDDFKEKGGAVIDRDFLKNTLDQYIARRDDVYLAEGNNQSRFDILRKSSLTENLENADVVDLLRKIDQVESQNLPGKIQELLKGGDLKRDAVSEVKQQELVLIKAKYETLLSRQLTTHFTRTFQTQFEKTIEEMGQTILKDKAPLSVKQLFEQIKTRLPENESFDQFMQQMEDHPRSELFKKDAYAQINREIMETAKKLIDKKTPLEDEFELIHSGEDARPVPATLEIKELKLYDQYDVGGFKLMNIINETFKGKELGALKDGDFETIYEKIQKEKEHSLVTEEGLKFLENHKGEIMAYKMSQLNLENKLFYGYIDIIQGIQKQNHQILELIQNLKK